jgi:hypothetical protein
MVVVVTVSTMIVSVAVQVWVVETVTVMVGRAACTFRRLARRRKGDRR